jgi:hypothetical protein
MVRRLPYQPIPDPLAILDRIEGDTFKIAPTLYNKRPIGLFFIDRKSRYRWLTLLKHKSDSPEAVKGFFKTLKNQYGRYPKEFHFDEGNEVTEDLKA